MANTLTNLIPDIYEALDIVSRELTGMVASVTRNTSANRLSKGVGESLVIPVTQAQAAADSTPGQLPPDTGDQTIDNVSVTISKDRHVPIRWNGDEQVAYGNNGTLGNSFRDQVAQGMRTLVNEMEADLCGTYLEASRAFGTAGTTPFGSSTGDLASARKILVDNGANANDLNCVIDTTAGVNLRSLTNLTNVNNAGGIEVLRQGELIDLYGIPIRESAGVQTHTAGTATGFDANGGEPLGETTIAVDGNDSGTILQGDLVSWVGDAEKYVVQSATASGGVSGNIVISEPGLRSALATAVEGSLAADYVANMVFARSAIILANRLPYRPEGGDSAMDVVTVIDPVTGLTFEIAEYGEYRQKHYEVGIAWGFKLIKPEHVALLIG